MTVPITISSIRRLTANPPTKRTEFRDSSLLGFLVRHSPSGHIAYYAQLRRGKRVRIGVHPAVTATQARDAARKLLSAETLGQYRDRPRVRFGDFVREHYEPWCRAHLKDPEAQLKRLEHNWSHLNDHLLVEVTTADVMAWRSRSRAKPATINRTVNVLRSVMSRATEAGFIDANPLTGLGVMKVDQNRPPRALTPDERSRFLAAVHARRDHMRALVLFLYWTACRRGEAFSLTWDGVDFDQKQVVIRAESNKSGRTRVVPLNSTLITELKAWRLRTRGELVFPGRFGERLHTVKRSWTTICHEAGIERFRLHDLRADAVSRMVAAGVPLPLVARIVGHSDIQTTNRYYTAFSDEAMREAVSAL
ncbi:MAG: tyrosine-type recombinase/integrase [Proteobacteria bacterium]|nr:tyrosine-type recombinase/integrase [Pseudomonadota bacterium]